MKKVNVTIVATINQQGKEALSHYLEKVGILYKKVDAKPVNKFKVSKPLIGDYTPSLVSIMEFPDMKSLHDVFDSDEYKELLPYREKAFSKLEAYISE
ncbi:DUF1330 domain-containing protein [Aquimarina sp. MMG015]|uniref:DUF1330 domain-containing protein n=1 Tax=unclassified Aquimarina TaxID=2627091 RepID=UPI000E5195FA|nr:MULTISPECIES: DUF1330 domain-containing protein [unclassified Aquimarina]AXT54573.1 DUF1330 domain-containing protein [Aquimarina sp. AD1]MBQ4804575.1 DUF1330 domain-containing protein [Aquimarina sp. MMG015]RKN25029.1 DUF1330 domain-containing protein [Aquimarina sp. AD1]